MNVRTIILLCLGISGCLLSITAFIISTINLYKVHKRIKRLEKIEYLYKEEDNKWIGFGGFGL